MIPNGALQRLQPVSWGEPACVQPVLPHIDVKRFFHGETKAGAMMFENGYVQQKISPAYNRARIECRGRKPFIHESRFEAVSHPMDFVRSEEHTSELQSLLRHSY